MCIINPFPAYRPEPKIVAEVTTHAVERYSREKINHILDSNPVSFLQVIHPFENPKQSMEDRLLSIKNKFNEFVSNNIFVHDTSPSYYVYRQIKDGRHHTGIMGLASVDDYNNNVIKIHEQTLALREEKLKEYLDVCEFNAEPVCLTYPHNPGLNEVMQDKMNERPLYDYSVDNIRHTVWIIDLPSEITKVQNLFSNIPYIYIADGHHRAASSARLAKTRKYSNPDHTGKEPYNFFTTALFADDELTIYGYHRLVQNLNGHTADSLLSELRKQFRVSILGNANDILPRKTISLYLGEKWYSINFESLKLNHGNLVEGLDVSVLSDYILSPLLGIKDIRHDKRISFLPGIKSPEEIEKVVDSGKMAAAFCLAPVSFDELLTVADSGKEMPPKSTWIEPKLESGLLIYSFRK